ncbi:MAG: sigma 54-interacting transcriptional regulator [Clostridia bacterium]
MKSRYVHGFREGCAIQTKEITRVGGTKPIHLDIRFIAATNSDLKKKIADGTFRQDLYYRLNVIPICIPPLRERLNDLDELCAHFVDEYTKKHNRDFVLTQDQLAIMKTYLAWKHQGTGKRHQYLTICASGTKEVADEMLKASRYLPGDEGSGSTLSCPENYEKALIESC